MYTFQNITNNSITVLGSNNSTDWVSLCVVNAANAKTTNSAFKFLCINSGTLLVNRAAAGSSATTALVNESGNPLPVAQTDGLAVSGTATSAAVLFTTSMLNYESITVQVTSAGSSCIVTYETSDDNTTWISIGGLSFTNTGSSALTTTSSAVGGIQFTRKGLYFRARVSTYGSGSTVTAIGTLSKAPVFQHGLTYIGGGASAEGGGAGTSPVAIGLECRTSSKTSVSNATLVRPIATTDGRQIVRLDSIPENEWSYVAASGGITNTTTAVSLTGGAGSGVRNYITSLQVSSDTLGTATEVVIQDGNSGPILWRAKIGTAGTVGIQDIRFHPPLRGSTNTLLLAACVTATGTGSIYLNVQGYKAP
ncbi:hypothetical protein [uncultured Flavobacterium sp.]|uniref:hypothetical protein n=1 Tax=uncultured Flavobacterium sp. TaxID=165435 RepID=UPI00259935DE|nr:hypothetical protein [uncultured Flavobacterium sp.]